MIRVFLIAASPLAGAALQNRIKGQSAKIVGSAASINAITSDLSDAQAEVLLVDAAGEPADAIIESLAESGLAAEIPTVVLTEAVSSAASAQALQSGIRALLPSEISSDQLMATMQAAAAGLIVLHPSEIPAALSGTTSNRPSQPVDESPEPLTRREREVLQMLAAGLANKEIAARLSISDHTAKFHVAAILGKLGAATRTEAVALGIRRGLVLL